MAFLGALVGAAGTALLQRTYLMENNASGIPTLLFVFDAVTSEAPEYSAQVTEHPVEDDPEITDHILLKNPTLAISGTVSASPLDLSTQIGNLVSGGISTVTSSQFRSNILNSGSQQVASFAGAKLLGNSATPNLAGGLADSLARSLLISAIERKARFDVITKRQRFESMVIQNLKFPRDSQTGAQLIFEIEMIRIRIVKPLGITVASLNEQVANSANPFSKLGNQSPKGVSSALSGSASSSLRFG